MESRLDRWGLTDGGWQLRSAQQERARAPQSDVEEDDDEPVGLVGLIQSIVLVGLVGLIRKQFLKNHSKTILVVVQGSIPDKKEHEKFFLKKTRQ